MTHLHELTATEIVQAIHGGRTTAVAVAEACLLHIESRDADVQAWEYLDPGLVLEQARALDRAGGMGPLQGVPVGLKDIIDTADMPTALGTPIHAGRRPTIDAACTALTRRAGGIIMGKTVTTEFANRFPGKSRNPHDVTRTPGGSSSGSGAAVGASMVPLAVGTQTTASTIRPASFCGCVGYVPSRGDIRTFGVMEAAASFDTVGLIARSVEDINLFRNVLIGTPPAALPEVAINEARIGFARTGFWNECDEDTKAFLEGFAKTLAADGAAVSDVAMPVALDEVQEAHRWVSSFEFVRNRTFEIDHHWERISSALRGGRIQDGMDCSFELYGESRETLRRCAALLDDVFKDYDVLLTPAVAGEAPVGLTSTGNASFSTLWTALNIPAITLPLHRGPNGMPVGLQLVSRRYADRMLLGIARAVSRKHG